MPEAFSLTHIMIVLAFLWFVAYWIVGGVAFAVISLSRFMHVNKVRFSCLFTLLSAAAAYAASWMGIHAVSLKHPNCLVRIKDTLDVFPAAFTCGSRDVLSAAGLWFLLLMVIGIGLMLILRGADEK